MKSSKFLKKEDVGNGALLTMVRVTQENVAKEGSEPEMKWALHFAETDKPLVLNSTNAQIIGQFTGSDHTDGWANKKVVLYHDPNIAFGGKLIGGIRARAPKQAAPAAPTPAPAGALPAADDDIPF